MTRWHVLFSLSAPVLLAAALPQLPTHFEPSTNGILARTTTGTYLITTSGALRSTAHFEMNFEGASAAQPELLNRLPGNTNYLRGSDPSNWRTAVPQFERVRFRNLYPGVDLLYHGAPSTLEYDLLIGPHTSPRSIVMRFADSSKLRLDPDGALIVNDSLRFAKPKITQDGKPISGGYKLLSARRATFSLGHYDHNRPLVIDPVLGAFATLGGFGLSILGTATDPSGNVYIAGNAPGAIPVVNALQPNPGTGNCDDEPAAFEQCQDVYIAKLNPAATQILYSTYIGDNGMDWFGGLAVDSQGSAYVAMNGDPPAFLTMELHAGGDMFVRKLTPDGSALVYDKTLASNIVAASMAVDASGNAYIAGTSYSASFPAVNAIQAQPVITPAYVTKDGGSTWSPVKIPAQQVNMLAIPPGQSSTIYAATSSGLFKSTDAGSTWTNLLPAAAAAPLVVLDPKTSSTVYAAYTTSSSVVSSTLARSTDSGATWTTINGIPNQNIGEGGPPAIAALAIDPENSSNLWILATNGLEVMIDKSTDAGNTWQITYGAIPVPPPFPFLPKEILIDPTNSAHVYACCANGEGGGVYFTQNGGATWTKGGTGMGSPPVLDPSNPSTLYSTAYPGLVRSTDGGVTWNALNFPSVPQNTNNVLIDSTTGVIYVISDAGYFLSSADHGNTWTITTTQGPWAVGSTLLAIDPAQPNTVYVSSPQTQIQDAFAIKLDASGNTLWGTLLGGSGVDLGQSIAVDAQGNAYIAGTTSSSDFPVKNAVQPTLDNGNGNQADAFVAEINSSGSTLVYSTYLGGHETEASVAIAVDATGEAYVTGSTMSPDFPLVNPLSSTFHEGFVTKFAVNGAKLLFSTFFAAVPSVVAVDSNGSPWLAGIGALYLPLVNEIQASFGGGFVSQLTPSGNALQFSTFFGGNFCDTISGLAFGTAGSVWIAGGACFTDFPSIASAQPPGYPSAFIARIDPAPPAAQPGVPRIDAVYNAASFQVGNVIAPGEVVTLIGAQLAASTQSATTVPLPTSLSDVSITIGGTPTPLYYVSTVQINLLVPTGLSLGISNMAITRNGNVTNRAVNIVAASPGIFVVTHSADFTTVTATNPAKPGEYLSVFCSGFGTANPLQVIAVVGGRETPVQFAGLAPGYIGLYQVNFQLLPDTSLENTDLSIQTQTSPSYSTNDVPLYVQ